VPSPDISVVIPAYNRAAYISDAIESVLAQEGCKTQVIVVDDGSTDDTAAVAERHGAWVTLVRQANSGPAHARNRGASLAAGRFIAFLDSDDRWLPGKSQADLDLFQRHPEADAVACDWEFWMLGELQEKLSLRDRMADRGIEFSGGVAFAPSCAAFWENGKQFATGTVTIRRDALSRLGERPFDERLRIFEDWDFEIRLLRCCRVLISPRLFVQIRLFDDGTRSDRAVRWRPPTQAQLRLKLDSRIHVLDKVLNGNLELGEVQIVELKRRELLRLREQLDPL
jgi:glycosyltransferase involved in cell wall biosynthesis